MRSVVLAAVIAAAVGLGSAAKAQLAEPVQVMVLGTYHFDNPGLDLHNAKADDVLKPHRQRELAALTAALAEFRPTKVMVERVSKTPDLLDPNYARFTRADLSRNRDERVQIGYRVASQLGLKNVYAIDERNGPGEPDYFPFDKLVAWAGTNGAKQRLNALMAKGAVLRLRLSGRRRRAASQMCCYS